LKNLTLDVVCELGTHITSVNKKKRVTSMAYHFFRCSRINNWRYWIIYLLVKRSCSIELSVWSTTTRSNQRSGKKSHPW
jgi:hypothetical protein